jgi:hypothetical protein
VVEKKRVLDVPQVLAGRGKARRSAQRRKDVAVSVDDHAVRLTGP